MDLRATFGIVVAQPLSRKRLRTVFFQRNRRTTARKDRLSPSGCGRLPRVATGQVPLRSKAHPRGDLPTSWRPVVGMRRRVPVCDAGEMRYVFRPPADVASGLLSLPWGLPLEEWKEDRLVEIRQRGNSRGTWCGSSPSRAGALRAKGARESLARREYRLLRALAELNIPRSRSSGSSSTADAQGNEAGRDPGAPGSSSTRPRTGRCSPTPRRSCPTDRLLDALVELLVRLHLSGFFWGDCSLSNTLFRLRRGHAAGRTWSTRRPASSIPTLTDGQRNYDVELAVERVGGELLDLAGGRAAAAGRRPAGDWPRKSSSGTTPVGDLTEDGDPPA